MSEQAIAITAGSGTNIDGYSQTNGNIRQAVVVGDASSANTATIGTNGLVVDGSGVTQPVSFSSLPAGTNTIGAVKVTDGTNTAKIFSLTNATPLAVAIVDGSGSQITSFGGGTQYTDGVTQSTPTGTVALGKNSSNIIHALSLDSSGNLNVNLAAGSISGGNAAASATGSAVPASADYTGFNSGGNLVGVSSSNPFPVTLANTGANTTALKVDNSGVTQPVSATSLPLPTGAATAAKQPALGSAGSASTDVLSVQGIASMTALKVDGSAVTQPVSLAQVPSSASLSDSFANPTTTQIASMNMLWNSSAWERLRGDLGDGSVSTGIQNIVPMLFNGSSYDRLYGDKFAGLWTNLKVTSSGGLTSSAATSAASTNATSVKASAGQVYGWAIFNTTSVNKYVKLYNKASAPTVGTDTPFMRILVPPSGGTNVWFGNGIPLGTGIAYAITGGAADTDTTSVAANDVLINLFYG